MKYKYIRLFLHSLLFSILIVFIVLKGLTNQKYNFISITYKNGFILFLVAFVLIIYFIYVFENPVTIGVKGLIDFMFQKKVTFEGEFLKCIKCSCFYNTDKYSGIYQYYYVFFFQSNNDVKKVISINSCEFVKGKHYRCKYGFFSTILIDYEEIGKNIKDANKCYRKYEITPFVHHMLLGALCAILFLFGVIFAGVKLRIKLRLITIGAIYVVMSIYYYFFKNTLYLGFKALCDKLLKKDRIIEAKFIRCEPILRSILSEKKDGVKYRGDLHILICRKKGKLIKIYSNTFPMLQEGKKYSFTVGKLSGVVLKCELIQNYS